MVVDCAVIGVPDERSGELPKAFIVLPKDKGRHANALESLTRDLHAHVNREKAKFKQLVGGIEFVDVVPRNPTGKILRRKLRDAEAQKARREGGARL